MSVGLSLERVGARQKALGETRFGVDQAKDGDLFLACVRSEKAPARIIEIDPSAALALTGVVRVFTAKDIPGDPKLGIIPVSRDQEFLAVETVKHPGQAVAFVAAETKQAALDGARAVKVRLEEKPGVFSAEEALAEGAPLVHSEMPGGNLLASKRILKGDPDEALRKSAVVVEAEYTTGRVEHSAIETEGGRAEYVDGRIVVHACTQNPHYDQGDLARFLGVEAEKVRVVQAETGGGFGGKLDLSVQPFLALASWHLKRGVRMTYSREESFLASGKRHPFIMRCITGADEQGFLTGLKVDMLADTGAFASYGLAVNTRAVVHATGPYRVPNLAAECRMAYTNNSWNGAMRGFGVPQAAVAHEGQMNALAGALGMDPFELRLKNVLRAGQRTGTGQLLKHGVGIAQCLEKIKPVYQAWQKEKKSDGRTLTGVGVGAMFYGIGNTGVSNPSTAQIEWTKSGRVVLCTGAADIGQGSDTVLRQIAATRLGLDPEEIEICRGDTDLTTNAGATSASRQTYISGNAVLSAAEALEMKILDGARSLLGAKHLDLALDGGTVKVKDGSNRELEVEEVVKPGWRTKTSGTEGPKGSFDPETSWPWIRKVTGQGSSL